PAAGGFGGPGGGLDARRAGRPGLRAPAPLRAAPGAAARPPAGRQAGPEPGGHRPVRPDPAAEAPDHLAPGGPGVPAEPRPLPRGAGGWRLGGDQAVRGDGHGHQHPVLDLPDRGRPRPHRDPPARQLLPRPQLRRGDAQGSPALAPGPRLHGPDPAGPVPAPRLLRGRAFGALTALPALQPAVPQAYGCGSASSRQIATCGTPSAPIQPRNMPGVLNGKATLPSAPSAIAPPSPPAAGMSRLITAPAACASGSPDRRTRAQISCAAAARM